MIVAAPGLKGPVDSLSLTIRVLREQGPCSDFWAEYPQGMAVGALRGARFELQAGGSDVQADEECWPPFLRLLRKAVEQVVEEGYPSADAEELFCCLVPSQGRQPRPVLAVERLLGLLGYDVTQQAMRVDKRPSVQLMEVPGYGRFIELAYEYVWRLGGFRV